MNRQSGEIRFSSIIWLLIAVVTGMVCYEAIPVKLRSSQFQDFMTESAKFSTHLKAEQLEKQIIDRGQFLNLPVDKKSVKVKKTNGRIKIEANYVIPLEFPGYTYSWEFKHFVDRPVFII